MKVSISTWDYQAIFFKEITIEKKAPGDCQSEMLIFYMHTCKMVDRQYSFIPSLNMIFPIFYEDLCY